MVTFIFGAGASIPFFDGNLKTTTLTNQLKNEEAWCKMIQKLYDNWPKDKPLPDINIKEIMNVIDAVCHTKKNANFEEIIEVIDKVATYNVSKQPTEGIFDLTLSVSNPKMLIEVCFCKRRKKSWYYVPYLAREIIATYILDLEKKGRSKNYDHLQNEQQNFIRQAVSDEKSSIVSLNYDNVVIDSAISIGYSLGNKNEHGIEIDAKRFFNNVHPIYFPHGHLRFIFNNRRKVEYYSCSQCADKIRWEDISNDYPDSQSLGTKEKQGYNFNSFIVSGQSKDNIFNYAPYAYYYQRLAIDCLESSTIYIIGYSFGDEHINRFLKAFRQLSKDNKLVVIDYWDGDVDILNERGRDYIIDRIYKITEKDYEIFCGHDTIKPMLLHPEGEQQLNKTGFGQIFDQVYFYKKGYKEFLKEYVPIVNSIKNE